MPFQSPKWRTLQQTSDAYFEMGELKASQRVEAMIEERFPTIPAIVKNGYSLVLCDRAGLQELVDSIGAIPWMRFFNDPKYSMGCKEHARFHKAYHALKSKLKEQSK